MIQNGIEKIIEKHTVIPVVTLNSEEDVHATVSKLIKAKINCAEITLRTSFALEGIEMMINAYPSIDVGVGTVVNGHQIDELNKIQGIKFMVSPGGSPSLLKKMNESKIPFLPGVVTPSEIVAGMELGVNVFKFFPANLFGGLKTLQTYGQVFPSAKFCPTGGLNADNHKDFLALSNVCAVGGSWMLK